MNIAFVCYKSEGKFSVIENENILLLEYLQSKGLKIKMEIWNDPEVDWSTYDLAILKAPWDYFDKFDQFKAWLTKLEQLNVRLLNPVATVRWNSDKHYLHEIEKAGLDIIPALFIEKGECPNLIDYFNRLNTEKLIIKPCVSGGAKNTFAVTKETAPSITPLLHELLEQEAFIVQPFIKEIQSEGEWSFLFFNGAFSHCLLKKAKDGDFRVQHIHGGSVHSETPPQGLLECTQNYVNTFAKECLYARVDGVLIDGRFYLMELELIEPYLYLFSNQNGFENYYLALQEMITQMKLSKTQNFC